MTVRFSVLAGGLLAVAALAVTVSSTSGDPSREASRGAGGAATGATAATPKRRLAPITPAEADVLHTAEQLLVRECMRRAGFRYFPARRTLLPDHRSFPYVVDDIDWARRHGYGSDLQEKLDELVKESPGRRYFESLPSDRRSAVGAAMNGPDPKGLRAYLPNGQPVEHSDKGCVSEARRRLYVDLPGWYRTLKLAESLPGFRAGLVLDDPVYRRGVQKWAACMRARGLRYPTPAHSRAAGLRLARTAEIGLAVAEATCATGSGLAGTARALDRRYDRVLRDRFRQDLTTHQNLQISALGRARAVVARG